MGKITHNELSPEFSRDLGRFSRIARQVDDWNDALENGIYQGNNAKNSPIEGTIDTNWWIGQVFTHDANGYVVQEVTMFTATDLKRFQRSKRGSWGAWVEITPQKMKNELNDKLTTKTGLALAVDDLNPIRHNGIFAYGEYTANRPPSGNSFGAVLSLVGRNENFTIQIAFRDDYQKSGLFYRHYILGTWYEWDRIITDYDLQIKLSAQATTPSAIANGNFVGVYQ